MAHLQIYHGHMNLAVWSPSGAFLASASIDPATMTVTIHILDSQGKQVQTLRGHSKCVKSLAWLDDTRLASGSRDHTIRIWNVNSGECVKTLRHESDVQTIAYSRLTSVLASGSDDKTIRIWDVETGQCVRTLAITEHVYSVTWNASGTHLASGHQAGYTRGSLGYGHKCGPLRIWDVNNGKCVTTLIHPSSAVRYVSWNATRLVSSAWNGSVCVWNTGTWTRTHEWKFGDYQQDVAWMDDTLLAVGCKNGVQIWDTETGTHVRTLALNSNDDVQFVGMNPACVKLSYGCLISSVQTWDFRTELCESLYHTGKELWKRGKWHRQKAKKYFEKGVKLEKRRLKNLKLYFK